MYSLIYQIKLEPEAKLDIQNAIDYYNEKESGLGNRFYQTIVLSFDVLINNPFYQIRYRNVRCFYIKPFPFLIHFVVEENTKIIHVLGVIHTSLNPSKWYKK